MPLDKNRSFQPVNIALLTLSDTRNAASDQSGDILEERLLTAGHHLVCRQLMKDELTKIIALFRKWIDDPAIDCIITTGGTGVTERDVTPEAVSAVAEKEIPGFGEYFRWISKEKIGTSTIQSRACGALANKTYIFALPGSPGACRDGWDEILAFQLDYRYRPCNFTELLPRLG